MYLWKRPEPSTSAYPPAIHLVYSPARMGSTIRRGTRDRPRWYGKYRDVDGHWKMRALIGARTKEDAKKALAAIETNVFKGVVGLPKRSAGHSFESTMRDWMATLQNRASDKYKGACEKY